MPNSKSFFKAGKLFYFAFALLINISNLFQMLKERPFTLKMIYYIYICMYTYVYIYNIHM